MRALLFAAVIFLLCVLAGVFLHEDRGHVSIEWLNNTYQMSLFYFTAGALILFGVLYYLVRFLGVAFRMPKTMQKNSEIRRDKGALRSISQATLEMSEGRWNQAEKTLTREIGAEAAVVQYMNAARAANEQNAYNQRDEYIKKAVAADATKETQVKLLQAELQIGKEQLEAANDTLKALQSKSPDHARVNTLLANTLEKANDWQGVIDLMPSLRRKKVLSNDALDSMEARAWGKLVHNADANDIAALWSKVPDSLKANKHLVMTYAKHHGDSEGAEGAVYNALKGAFDEELASQYARVAGGAKDAKNRLEEVEKLLRDHPGSQGLLSSASSLCNSLELWGKAKGYIEKSLEIGPNRAGYAALGDMLEKTNKFDEAREAYKKALTL